MAGLKSQTQRRGRPPRPRRSRWASTRGWSSARNSSTTQATGATRRSCPTWRSARACCRRSTARSRSRGPSTSSQSREIEAVTRRATGPITAEGKAVSSQNARRHGLNAAARRDLVSRGLTSSLIIGRTPTRSQTQMTPARGGPEAGNCGGALPPRAPQG